MQPEVRNRGQLESWYFLSCENTEPGEPRTIRGGLPGGGCLFQAWPHGLIHASPWLIHMQTHCPPHLSILPPHLGLPSSPAPLPLFTHPLHLRELLSSSKPYVASLCPEHKAQTPSMAHEGQVTIPDPPHYPLSAFPTLSLSPLQPHSCISMPPCLCTHHPLCLGCLPFPLFCLETSYSRFKAQLQQPLLPEAFPDFPSILSNPRKSLLLLTFLCHAHQAGGVLGDREWISFACILSTGHRTSINID